MDNELEKKYYVKQKDNEQHLFLKIAFTGNDISNIDCGEIDSILNKVKLYNEEYITMMANNELMKKIQKDFVEKDKEIERLTNIVNKIEDMLQSPWNIECVNQNNEFLSKIKVLKEGNDDE